MDRTSEISASRNSAFSLVELLVVIAIIAIVAGLLFPVFSSAKKSAKRTDCLSNLKQIGEAMQLYLGDSDDVYPQTRQSSTNPQVQDVAGAIDEPIYEQVFKPILSYTGQGKDGPVGDPLFVCPEDDDPLGSRCLAIDPDAPDVTSYLANAYFVFGLGAGSVTQPSNTILAAERRSDATDDADPFCDDIYHPWFNAGNTLAPDNEMDAVTGAVATQRHLGLANYQFADGHTKALHWAATYAPPSVNLHVIDQP